MNYYLKILTTLSFIIIVLLISCQSHKAEEKNEAQSRSPFIPIPEVFDNETLIAKHLVELSENLDAFASIMEDIANDFEAININMSEEPSLRQKLRITRVVMPKIQPVMDIVSNINKLDKTSQSIKDTLSKDKLIAYRDFEKAYNERFENLNKRFEDFLSE